jgi:hypothetical protein
MTTSAWVMLTATWSVVTYFTVRFFIAVLRTPMKPGAGGSDEES